MREFAEPGEAFALLEFGVLKVTGKSSEASLSNEVQRIGKGGVILLAWEIGKALNSSRKKRGTYELKETFWYKCLA